MSSLLDAILDHVPYDTITDTELTTLLRGSAASRHNQLKRAVAKGDLLHIRRGVYQLAKRYQRKPVNPYELSQKIYGPSYVSFESALSFHGLIPEGVYSVACASLKRSREFRTPLGVYAYKQIPKRVFYIGVDRVEKDTDVFLMAMPFKALADILFSRRLEGLSSHAFLESLRIDKQDLKIDPDDVQVLVRDYRSERVRQFFEELLKEVAL